MARSVEPCRWRAIDGSKYAAVADQCTVPVPRATSRTVLVPAVAGAVITTGAESTSDAGVKVCAPTAAPLTTTSTVPTAPVSRRARM